jgi:glycosyltransferase involved in cell wall biosynthesis
MAQQGFQQAGVAGEILIADNGSTDGSQSIAESLGARVVAIQRKGYGEALRGGIEAALGDYIIMGDSDESYDFTKIAPFTEKLQAGHDLVMGCRMPWGGGTVLPEAMPWKHFWIGNPALTFLGKIFFRTRLNDFHCGLRGFRRKAILDLNLQTTGMEFATEMIMQAVLNNLSLAEVPITLHPDGRSRPPHLRSWRDGWRHLRFMLLFAPAWIFILPAGIGLLGGLLGIALIFFKEINLASARLAIGTQVVTLFLFLFSYMALTSGFLAKLYGKTTGLLIPRDRIFLQLLALFSLERGLFIGICIMAGGISIFLNSIWIWSQAGFQNIPMEPNIQNLLLAMILIAVGLNTLLTSFLAGIISLPIAKPLRRLLQPSEDEQVINP